MVGNEIIAKHLEYPEVKSLGKVMEEIGEN